MPPLFNLYWLFNASIGLSKSQRKLDAFLEICKNIVFSSKEEAVGEVEKFAKKMSFYVVQYYRARDKILFVRCSRFGAPRYKDDHLEDYERKRKSF